MLFRDDFERKAHDIICVVRYGGLGGQVRIEELRRVGDILRGHPLSPPVPKVVVPKINGLPVVVMHNPATAPVIVPPIVIKVPGL